MGNFDLWCPYKKKMVVKPLPDVSKDPMAEITTAVFHEAKELRKKSKALTAAKKGIMMSGGKETSMTKCGRGCETREPVVTNRNDLGLHAPEISPEVSKNYDNQYHA